MNSLARALEKQQQAQEIVEELQLLQKWHTVGDCYIVGATAYNLIVTPDIDLETFCDEPNPKHIMQQLASLVAHPNVLALNYHDYTQMDFQGHYFKLTYTHNSIDWTIDMWLFSNNRRGALSRDLVPFMNSHLTDDTRDIILTIKEALIQRKLNFSSIFIYQAVLEFEIQTIDQFLEWTNAHDTTVPFHWKPSNH